MSLCKAALWYAKRGWYVLPLKPGLKTPASLHGLSDATTEPERIRAWWKENPEYNIGISCGPSGLVALDVDPKNGAEPGAVRTEFGEVAVATVVNLTPSGGMHYLYLAGDREVHNSAGKLGAGLDIRGVGGYIVVPPSVFEGKRYTWEVDSGPADREPAAVPETLIAKLSKRGPTLLGATVTELIPAGQRNAHLAAIAGRMRRNGMSAQEIDAALQVANTARCRPPLSRLEVQTIAKSIARYTPEAPVTLQPSPAGVLTFDQLARRSNEHVDWYVEGLLRQGGIMLLASRPKVGKSDLARNLIRSIATGNTFLGRRCKAGNALWIGLEEPVSHLLERVELLGMQDLPISWVVDQPKGDKSLWLTNVILEHKPDFVVVDTIGRFADIENINDYSQVTRATQPFIDLRTRYGTTFVLLHHNNAMNTTLGSTMWEGVVDTVMSLTCNADDGRFVKTKQRSGVNMEATALTLDRDTGIISAIESKYLLDQRIAEQRILAYLRKQTGLVAREDMARHCGRALSVGRAAVDALASAGLLRVTGTGAKGDPRLYCLRETCLSMVSSEGGYKDEESDESDELSEEWTKNTGQSILSGESGESVLSDAEADMLLAYANKRINEA